MSAKRKKSTSIEKLKQALHLAWMDVVLEGSGMVLITKDGARHVPRSELKPKRKKQRKR